MTNKEWFKEAKFGMMIHWGLYSLLAGEYNGQRYDYNDEMVKGWDPVGEWIMPRYEIPIKEYEKLAQAFNPVFFNADEWVALAKEAGSLRTSNMVLLGAALPYLGLPKEYIEQGVKDLFASKGEEIINLNLTALNIVRS